MTTEALLAVVLSVGGILLVLVLSEGYRAWCTRKHDREVRQALRNALDGHIKRYTFPKRGDPK